MRRETASKSYYLGERAIVVGGGLAGLSAARALSDRFGQIVILTATNCQTVPPRGLAFRKVNTPTAYWVGG